MSIDEQHVALPKLYGAPAYARPPGPTATVARPFDPDDLPIDAYMTDDERDFASDPAGPSLGTGRRDRGGPRRRTRTTATPSRQPASGRARST